MPRRLMRPPSSSTRLTNKPGLSTLKDDTGHGGVAENLTIIADFNPTPELRELLAKNFHAEELGIKTDAPPSDSSSHHGVAKRNEWCPDYSLRDHVIHGWAPWNTAYDVGCII
ncbi:hypothetical protein B0T16DRAFT_461428 [Cercophora newfieldiana]|uniref:Uncharacterized protein n=1 Tax=Cercophora newfieldiana TaxID=92897 RepID=A0AA39XYH4_9PEZI|nr:hypothetical protein B0T16DRAFT_461428 [Cercophora newfieldiana]